MPFRIGSDPWRIDFDPVRVSAVTRFACLEISAPQDGSLAARYGFDFIRAGDGEQTLAGASPLRRLKALGVVIELVVFSRSNPSTAAIWKLKGHARILAFIGEHLCVRRTLRQQLHQPFHGDHAGGSSGPAHSPPTIPSSEASSSVPDKDTVWATMSTITINGSL